MTNIVKYPKIDTWVFSSKNICVKTDTEVYWSDQLGDVYSWCDELIGFIYTRNNELYLHIFKTTEL